VYRFSATHTLSDFPLLIGEMLRRGKFVLGAVPSGACFLRESKGTSEIAISTVLLATAAICEAQRDLLSQHRLCGRIPANECAAQTRARRRIDVLPVGQTEPRPQRIGRTSVWPESDSMMSCSFSFITAGLPKPTLWCFHHADRSEKLNTKQRRVSTR
jgi:hypothetical protein